MSEKVDDLNSACKPRIVALNVTLSPDKMRLVRCATPKDFVRVMSWETMHTCTQVILHCELFQPLLSADRLLESSCEDARVMLLYRVRNMKPWGPYGVRTQSIITGYLKSVAAYIMAEGESSSAASAAADMKEWARKVDVLKKMININDIFCVSDRQPAGTLDAAHKFVDAQAADLRPVKPRAVDSQGQGLDAMRRRKSSGTIEGSPSKPPEDEAGKVQRRTTADRSGKAIGRAAKLLTKESSTSSPVSRSSSPASTVSQPPAHTPSQLSNLAAAATASTGIAATTPDRPFAFLEGKLSVIQEMLTSTFDKGISESTITSLQSQLAETKLREAKLQAELLIATGKAKEWESTAHAKDEFIAHLKAQGSDTWRAFLSHTGASSV